MSKISTTYDLSASQIAPYVQPIAAGALANCFEIRDETGRFLAIDEDYNSGKHLLLVFLNSSDEQMNLELVESLAKNQSKFTYDKCVIIVITANNSARQNNSLKQQTGFTGPICGDSTGAVFAAYGLHKCHGEAVRLVLLTPLKQVRAWFDSPEKINDTLEVITDMIENHKSNDGARWVPSHAPVLHIPNVLSAEECTAMIESFNKDIPYLIRPPRPGETTGNFKVPVYEHNRQDRIDMIIRERKMIEFIDSRIGARIAPMIAKAFAFNVTRHEDLHIARYTGERNGLEMGHRDNTSPETAYRRFAMSLSLNSDYEGGELHFKEYSPFGYKPAVGSAMIFSSSLLHEVSEITSGVRYNLVSNLYNEDSFNRR